MTNKSIHTNEMPWDKIWDFKYYKISRVRLRKLRIKILKEKNDK